MSKGCGEQSSSWLLFVFQSQHSAWVLSFRSTEVGRLLGNRDHSTVIHGAGKINGEINEDYQLRQNVLTIKEAIFT